MTIKEDNEYVCFNGLWRYHVYCVAAIWTQNSMRRQSETTRRFTRQRRQKVNLTISVYLVAELVFYYFTPLYFITLEHKHLLKNAQLELKKSKRKDYYKILGVDKNATEDEIKKAYRKRALLHHPGALSQNPQNHTTLLTRAFNNWCSVCFL